MNDLLVDKNIEEKKTNSDWIAPGANGENFFKIDDSLQGLLKLYLPNDLREHMTGEHIGRIVDFLKSGGSPGVAFYECSDGRILYPTASDHVHQYRALLQTLGIFDRAIAEGMVLESPFSENGDGNNIIDSPQLTPHNRQRLRTMIAERIKTRPAKEWEQLLRDANVPVTVVQTDSEWLADEKLLEGGVVADVEDPRRQLDDRRVAQQGVEAGAALQQLAVAPRRQPPALRA